MPRAKYHEYNRGSSIKVDKAWVIPPEISRIGIEYGRVLACANGTRVGVFKSGLIFDKVLQDISSCSGPSRRMVGLYTIHDRAEWESRFFP